MVRRAHHVEPLACVDLVGANDSPDIIVEYFSRSARQRRETRLLELLQIAWSDNPNVAAPCDTSSGEKA